MRQPSVSPLEVTAESESLALEPRTVDDHRVMCREPPAHRNADRVAATAAQPSRGRPL